MKQKRTISQERVRYISAPTIWAWDEETPRLRDGEEPDPIVAIQGRDHWCVSWHDRETLRRLAEALEARGFRRIGLPEEYTFPIVVIDPWDKLFFGSNTTCMAARASCGFREILEPDEALARLDDLKNKR